ncbi:MAG: retron system putative HNH endonuclease [Pseudomonadota bacterium]
MKLCCYCEQRLDKSTSHIEHFRPRETYPDLTLVYDNFLCSCPGWKEGKRTDPQEHCGASKGNWFDENLMVSPLEPPSEKYFQYTLVGEIRPNYTALKAKAAEATIEHCKLNHAILIKMREEALEGLDDLNQDEALQLIKSYRQRDSNDQYQAFCSAIIYFLSTTY